MVLTNVNGDLIILSPASRNAPPSDDQASTTSPSTAVSPSSPVLALVSLTPTRGSPLAHHTEHGLLTRRLSAMLDGTPTSNIWWETLESCRTPVLSSNRSESDDQVIILLFLFFDQGGVTVVTGPGSIPTLFLFENLLMRENERFQT